MASTGKKGKKSKEKKLSLQDFLAKSNPQAGSGGTTQVAVQKYSSWAEECEEDEDRKIEIIQLPTAPRATRILDDNSIPNDPPFYARVSNLPFDINETDVDEFFLDQNIHIREMKLARDDNNDRLRGFGHIEFETREDLLDAIMLTDPMIRNRRIRIEFTAEPDSSSGRTLRKRYDNYTPRDSANESTNWRDRKESNFETLDSRGNRENRGRNNFQQRSTFQNRHDTNNNSSNDSNWRLGERPNDSPPPERRRYGNDRRDGGDGGGRRGGGRYNDREQREQIQEERPKLNIQPRTLPLPEMNFPKEEELERGTRKISINGDKDQVHDDSGLPEDDDENKESASVAPKPKPTPVPREQIFGSAKPVDTMAREREIEEKMEQERQERMKAEKEKRNKERELQTTTSQSDISNNKDIISYRTESSRRQEETNWRKRDENSSNGSIDNNKHNNRGGNRQIGRSEYDDRPRQFNKDNRDNRNNSFNNRGGMNRGDRRDNNIRRGGDHGGIRRSNDYQNSGGKDEMRREERDREPRRDRNYELPKFVENSGPNLKTSNAFEGLTEEENDD